MLHVGLALAIAQREPISSGPLDLGKDLSRLKAEFNAAKDRPRMLLILSPT